jgi:uncharacterized protein
MGKLKGSVRVLSLKNQALIADKVYVAECFVDRLRGLIGKSGLAPGHGMLFPKCNNIHMWFMKFPIDVVFVRSQQKEDGSTAWIVSSAHESVRPWRVRPLMDFKATDTLELPSGIIRQFAINPGDELCIGSSS